MKISQKLILHYLFLVLICTCGLGSAGIFFINNSTSKIKKETHLKDTQNHVKLLDMELDHLSESLDLEAQTLSNYEAREDGSLKAETKSQLKEYKKKHHLAFLAFHNSTGPYQPIFESTSLKSKLEGLPSKAKASFNNSNKGFLFSRNVNPSFSLSALIKLKQMLGSIIPQAQKDQFILSFEDNKESFISPDEKSKSQFSAKQINFIKNFRSSKESISTGTFVQNSIFASWQQSKKYGFTLWSVVPKSTLSPQFSQSLGTIFMALAIIIIFSTFLTFLFSKTLTEKLFTLTETAEKISRGDVTLRAPQNSQDEFGTLAKAFNLMTDSLVNTYRTLAREIEERKKVQEEYQHLTQHDPLTNLINRKALFDKLSRAVEKAKGQKLKVALMLCDLDRFKTINDTLGYAVGDQLIKETARRIQSTVGNRGTVARVGGDEFMILLDQVMDSSKPENIAKELLQDISETFEIKGSELVITPSVGISIFPNHNSDPDSLIQMASTALNQAKKMGKNSYLVFSPQMNTHSLEKLTLEHSLHKALDRDEFSVYYQPKVELKSGKITGMEALLRWKHPRLGFIPPDQFIPIAEETGLIHSIGIWVLKAACKQTHEWHQSGFRNLSIAVNLSGKQLNQSDIIDNIIESLEETCLPPQFLDLEITEGVFMQNAQETLAFLQRLKEIGVLISIDDFGTGYSSFSYLKRFPIGNLKIDRSFISELPENADDTAIVKAIIAMATTLKLKVVAEGVETADQLEFLRDLDCNEIQGYFISRPLPAEEMTKYLSEKLDQKVI